MQLLKLAPIIFSALASLTAVAVETSNEKNSNLIVQISNGFIRGKDNGYYYSYESIPYAEPPLGDLRFEKPKAYNHKWNDDEIFDATRPPIACMQWDQFTSGENKLNGQEDCLTVNIYKPKTNISENERLPVWILIHGGAFMFGKLQENEIHPVMRSGRVIVAMMTYRLGPLGFLSTEDNIIPGNYGLWDQRLAINWIKQNIENFGGDNEKILLLGFSAGGASVHLQLLHQNLTGIVKVAASLDGNAFNPWVITQKSRERAFQMAKNLNCSNTENSIAIKACLKAMPAKSIVRNVRDFLVFGYNPFTTFGPVIDNNTETPFLSDTPENLVRNGKFQQLPWLASYATQSGGYNAAELLQIAPRDEELIEVLNERWFDLAPYVLFYKDHMKSVEELDDYSMALKKHYMGNNEFNLGTYPLLQRMYTDILFKNGTEKAVRLQREYGKSPIYSYVYDNPSDVGIGFALSQRKDIQFGTVHGDDFFLIFNNPSHPIIRPDEAIISRKLINMLADFAQKGELHYDNCAFINNVGHQKLQLLRIKKDSCQNEEVNTFP